MQDLFKYLLLTFLLLASSSFAQDSSAGGLVFPVYEFEVKGNSLLSALQIEKAVTPFAGEKKTIADVEQARLALERTYHEAGYLSTLVLIPEQNVDSALVQLLVIEANVGTLTIKGAEFTAPSVIRSRLTELTSQRPPNFNALQAQLAQINSSNDIKVTPILKQGSLPGSIDVQIDVEDQSALHGSVEINNRHIANQSPTRLVTSIRYDNLFQEGHSAGLSIQKSPELLTDLSVYSLNYSVPLKTPGQSVSFYAVRSRSQFLSGDLVTDGDTLGFRFNAPLKGSESFTHGASIGLDYKNQRVFIAELNKGAPQYVPFVGSYSGTFLGRGSSTGIEATLTNGLRGMFTNTEANFNDRGRGASANFSTLKLSLSRTDLLNKWSLNSKLDARGSSGILLSPEQMTLGGAESVRGYYEGERVGDHGYRASLELRTPSATIGQGLSELRLIALGFYEGGAIFNSQRLTTPASKDQLLSSGLGLRLSAPRGFSLDADFARALLPGSATPANDRRYTVRTVWSF